LEKKWSNPQHHPLKHGGLRNFKFSSLEHQKIRSIIWLLCNIDPTQKIQNYVTKLQELGYDCGREFVRKIFCEWKWSWKKPEYIQLQKYTEENVKRYKDYAEWIVNQDLSKVKYMDEVHFVSKNVSKNKVLSPIGQKKILMRQEHFAETYSATCICSLSEEDPTYINLREDSNTGMDFARFLLKSISDGYIKEGDILIMDNASIHGSLDNIDILYIYLLYLGITIIYLPTYSPEFNPCELIFSQVKHYLRNHRDGSIPLSIDIIVGFALISKENVLNYYNKCCRNTY